MKTKCLAFLLALIALPAFAAVINFDDLDGAGTTAIEDGYGGFNWNNGAASIGTVSETLYPGSGYAMGTVSHANTAFNFNGTSGVAVEWAGMGSFNFMGAFFTSAWLDQEIAFEGYKGGNLVYASDAFTLNTQSPQWINLDWADIDSLWIYNIGEQWAMDDFTYTRNQTQVPEPAPFVLFGLGLLALAVKRKMRNQ